MIYFYKRTLIRLKIYKDKKKFKTRSVIWFKYGFLKYERIETIYDNSKFNISDIKKINTHIIEGLIKKFR